MRSAHRSHPTRKKLIRVISALALLAGAFGVGCTPENLGENEGAVGTTQQAVVSSASLMVNQLGYAPGATKIGVLMVAGTTTGTVKVLNSSGTVVFTGGTTVARPADTNSGEAVQLADFTAFTTAGTGYKLRVTIGTTDYNSEAFDINNNAYGADLAKAALKYFNWKRSGMTVAADSTFSIAGHGASHTGDSALAAYGGWTTASFDVLGGWYDAGDNGKYMESHTAATWGLANMFERTKGIADPSGTKIETLGLGLTDSALPDVLDEIAWGTRWVRGAMPNPTAHPTDITFTDLVSNKCTSNGWPPYPVAYTDDTTARTCMGPSLSATHGAARNMAMVARLLKSDPSYATVTTLVSFSGVNSGAKLTASAYADELWTRAEEAFYRATGKHPTLSEDATPYVPANGMLWSDLNMAQSPGFNTGSGAYGDEDMKDDEYAASVEMYLTACARDDATAVAKYKPLVTGHSYYKRVDSPCDWGSERMLGDINGEETSCGTVSLLTAHDRYCTGTEALPTADLDAMKANLRAHANSVLTKLEGQNFPFHAGNGNQIVWGSNGAQAGNIVMLVSAYELSSAADKDKKYLRGAGRLMDYLLGVNPKKISYIIGFGEATQQYTHDRAMNASGGTVVRGTLVGGPHNVDDGLFQVPTGPTNPALRTSGFVALASRFGGANNIADSACANSGPVLRDRFSATDTTGGSSWECGENAGNWNAALANAAWSLQVEGQNMAGTTTSGCTAAADCNDNNPCTVDACSSGVCANTAGNAGAACNDGNAATTNDKCTTTGTCAGTAGCTTAADCNDNNVCTTDACNSGTCANTNNTLACATDNNACTNDVCSAGSCTHPAVANNTTCDDGSATTCNDVCTSGTCGGGSCGSSCSGSTGSGSISWDKWTNQSGTALITNLLTTTPNSTGTLTSFEAPLNSGDSYQLRVKGYLTAPCTGTYTFWVAGDDNTELWLSTNNSPTTKVKIASVTGWTNSQEWNKYTSQKSAGIALTGGQKYYIEAILKEGTGGDNLAVGWAKPGEATTVPSQVIPGNQLSPFTSAGCSSAADCNDNNACTNDACNSGTCAYTNNTAGCATDNNACTNDVCSAGACTHPAAASGTACDDGNASTTGDTCNGSGTCGGACAAPGAPAAPTGSTGNAQISLSWGAVSGATSYKVYRDTSSSGAFTTVACSPNPTATSCTAGSLTNGTSYYFKVSAVNACTEGSKSAASSGISPTSCTASSAPATPSAPTAANTGVGSVQVSWTAVTGATGYTVYRSTTSGGTYTSVGTATSTSFINTGLSGNTTYYYKVAASNCFGPSAQSNSSTVTTAYTCSDGVQNGAETGVDCGGSACTACGGGGSTPCAGLCSPIVSKVATGSGNLGTGAICHEIMTMNGGNCGNMDTRVLTINGTAMTCNWANWSALPAKRNGGYCLQVPAGNPEYASYSAW